MEAIAFAIVDPVTQHHAHAQQGSGDKQHWVHSGRHKEAARHTGAENGAQRTTYADNREKPLALLLRVNIVCKSPKLSDEHQVEESYPNEKHNSERHVVTTQLVEHDEIRGKKSCDTVDQTEPIQPARHLSIEWNEDDKHQRRGCTGISFDFRASTSKNKRLTNRFDDVVGRHQKEQVHHQ